RDSSYARLHGIGAAAVTYSVGAFNLLNACGGAYVEHVPLIAVNACPPYEQWQNYRALGLLTSHMSPRRESNLDAYRQVTVEAQVISNPGLAPGQIDAALTACLSKRRPVYLEVMEDLWDEPCAVAEEPLLRRERPFSARNQTMLASAVAAILALVEEHPGPDGRPRPIVWAGEEVERFRLDRQLGDLIQATGVPFCTTVGAKAVLDERLPQFHGVYNGKASHPEVHAIFKDWATCRIGLGTWSTSKNLGGELSVGTDWVVAARGGVSVGTQYFPDVQLARLLPALQDALVARFGSGGLTADYFAEAHAHHGAAEDRPASLEEHRATTLRAGGSSSGSGERLTYDGVFDRTNHFLAKETRESWTVVSDAAFSLIGSMDLTLPAGGFLSQVSWLSIGWSVGDGADFYNVLHPWHYERLADVFSGKKTPAHGVGVAHTSELDELLARLTDPTDPVNSGPLLVRV
ncbi:alpha-keto acid decarboxylase family protein, partial [Streptomyces albiflaviniger]|nr:alpha-keto acid decarboxylase family protein [Streptomyces albiflaviniger]